MERGIGIEPELHFQYYLKHLEDGGDGDRFRGRGRGAGSVKWKKRGSSVFTMHATGNIARGMPKILARKTKSGRKRQGCFVCRIDLVKKKKKNANQCFLSKSILI